jgi:hypothetical protein
VHRRLARHGRVAVTVVKGANHMFTYRDSRVHMKRALANGRA